MTKPKTEALKRCPYKYDVLLPNHSALEPESESMKPKYTFEIFQITEPRVRGASVQGAKQSWYWRCRHRNGKIVADGAEGYASKAKLRRSLARLIRALHEADCEIKEAP